jgi:MFS family permease
MKISFKITNYYIVFRNYYLMHHSHHKLMHYLLKNKTLSEFYFMVGMRRFGYSLISVFLPIYIFLIRNSLLDVVIFLIFSYIASMIFFPIVGKLTSKIGNIHTILISAPLMVLFFYLLESFDPLLIGLPVLGFLRGIQEAFFWMPFHEEFSFISKSKEMGSETSIVKLTFSIAGIIAPLIGSIIIILTGFELLFLLVLVIIIIGAIPLLFSKEVKPKQKFKFKLIFSKKYRKLFIPFIGNGVIATSNEWLWPILMFLVLANFYDIGIFSTIINTVAICTLLVVMLKSKTVNMDKVRKIGTVVFSLSVILRSVARDFFSIISVWSLGALAFILFSVPFESKIYAVSKHMNKLEFFVAREWAINVGRLLILGIVSIFLYDVMLALTAGIFSAGVLILLTLKF